MNTKSHGTKNIGFYLKKILQLGKGDVKVIDMEKFASVSA